MKKIIIFLFLLTSVNTFGAGKWTIYRIEKENSPKNDITSLCFDKQNNLWAATSYGVFMFANGSWAEKGIQNAYVQTIFVDNNDTKWAGLYAGGVHRSADGNTWEKVPGATVSGSVNAITADKNGAIWVGDWNEGAFSLTATEKNKWIQYRAEKQTLGDNAVLSITADPKKQVWIGTTHGVSAFANNKWTLYNTQNSKLPDNVVYSLASGANNVVWIGTSNGLVKVKGTEWTVYNDGNSGLSCDLILVLAPDEAGNIWIGTNNGVFCFNGEKWENYTVENSRLPDNRVQSIVAKNGKVYIGTSRGLAVYE